LEFKPKNEGSTSTGSRLIAVIVAVYQVDGQPKKGSLPGKNGQQAA
jgi:hypothetical protein